MAKEISQDNFEAEVLKSDKPVLVDFWAPWCGPCRAVAPILEEISNENPDVKIVKVDVDANPELAMTYRIQSIPAMMIFKDGKVAASRVGSSSKKDLTDWINKVD